MLSGNGDVKRQERAGGKRRIQDVMERGKSRTESVKLKMEEKKKGRQKKETQIEN